MKSYCLVPLLVFLFAVPLDAIVADEQLASSSAWESGFRQPPEATKPWCYWYWISDNISKEGITKDLESMAEVGIGEAFIGNIFLEDIPAGDIKVLSAPWWKLVEHAIREGSRVGVNIGMFNCPGWSQSGGPWIKADQAMRYLVSSETRVQGPSRFEGSLPAPAEPFQDVAVVAFPAPQDDAKSLGSRSPRVSCRPKRSDVGNVVDGNLDTALVFPARAGQGNNAFVIEIAFDQPWTARSLSLTPSTSAWSAQCELQAADHGGDFQVVRQFPFDRSNMKTHVGPMPRGPVTVAFESVASRRFRLRFTGVTGEAGLAEIDLSPAARVESFVEKQLGKMHPTPLPMWDTYLWPAQPEPDPSTLSITPSRVVDLSETLASDGTLRWDVPPGEWVILRTGMTTTGTRNSPASPEGQGLEVDKMNRRAAKGHFDAFVGELLRRLPRDERRALKHVVADSYEMGSQNWTDGFETKFQDRYGYDPIPWLPVLTGRVVGSAEQSDRFLWDLRRLVADRIAVDYVGGLRDLCRSHGLQLWLENYGHWGFPAEFLQYGGQSDRLGGEFWVTGSLGSIECRAASSAANIYDFPFVSAEAFTGGPPYQTVPSGLKARGDWAFCEGINHFVLHVYIHQPWEQRRPGMNAWFGTEFNRHNTWFHDATTWIDYLRRSCFLLQQGTRVADVAYFIGDDTPKMTGIRQPELPSGRDFDYINADVIQNDLSVEEGQLTLPHGTRYRLLVLPDLKTMRPELLRKIRDLVASGATVLGPAPQRSPSLENYPACDDTVRRLAAELWGDTEAEAVGEHRFGNGRVIWGQSLSEVFANMNLPADFNSSPAMRYTHRVLGDSQIYFVANPQPREALVNAAFRVSGKTPEFWSPDSGRVERPAVFQIEDDLVRVPIHLGPHGSVFVVFRDAPSDETSFVAVKRNGKVLMDATMEFAKLSDAMTRPGTQLPAAAVKVTRNCDGDIQVIAWQAGKYELQTAHGNS
ncbi:MAG: glycosyl hydrolase, partial [Pirellulaceae bacterium]